MGTITRVGLDISFRRLRRRAGRRDHPPLLFTTLPRTEFLQQVRQRHRQQARQTGRQLGSLVSRAQEIGGYNSGGGGYLHCNLGRTFRRRATTSGEVRCELKAWCVGRHQKVPSRPKGCEEKHKILLGVTYDETTITCFLLVSGDGVALLGPKLKVPSVHAAFQSHFGRLSGSLDSASKISKIHQHRHQMNNKTTTGAHKEF